VVSNGKCDTAHTHTQWSMSYSYYIYNISVIFTFLIHESQNIYTTTKMI